MSYFLKLGTESENFNGMTIEISNDDGSTWTNIKIAEEIAEDNSDGQIVNDGWNFW